MSKKMGSLEFTIFILLSVIHQILSDRPISCVLNDESYVAPEFRMKRSHAFQNNLEKRDEATRANIQATAKHQAPKTRPMNLCIGEPVTRRRTAVPVIQNKATATVIRPKNVATATIIQPKDVITGTIVHPKVTNTATIGQQKPVATATIIQPIQPQINPTISVVQSKCIPVASIIQPNVISTVSALDIEPKATAIASTIQTKTDTICAKPIITELDNCTIIHQVNSTKTETHHVFHDINGNSNDSLKTEHHYIVDIPIDHNSNNSNTIHHVIVNHTHSVNGKNSNGHEKGAFYEETSNGAKIFHTVSQDTSPNPGKAATATFSTSNSTVTEVTVQNSTDTDKVCSCTDKPEVFEMATPKPNLKQENVKTLSDVLKQVNVQLLSTPKPLISGNIGGIKVVENKMEEHNLDKIKLEPDDDIVIDKFDVEEVKESYKNPTDYTNDVSSVSSGWCIYPTINNQGIQSTNGAIISYDDYVNYYNTGGYKDDPNGAYSYGGYDGNSKAAYNYPYNKPCVTQAPKAKKLSKADHSVVKDRIWRKWINTQIYIRRPSHANASPKVDEHVKSTSWSQEQKIPVIGYNGYYTNQNSSYCS